MLRLCSSRASVVLVVGGCWGPRTTPCEIGRSLQALTAVPYVELRIGPR